MHLPSNTAQLHTLLTCTLAHLQLTHLSYPSPPIIQPSIPFPLILVPFTLYHILVTQSLSSRASPCLPPHWSPSLPPPILHPPLHQFPSTISSNSRPSTQPPLASTSSILVPHPPTIPCHRANPSKSCSTFPPSPPLPVPVSLSSHLHTATSPLPCRTSPLTAASHPG